VTIDADLPAHFGSAEVVNDALPRVVAEDKKAAGSRGPWNGARCAPAVQRLNGSSLIQ
jgi:hypothetical protein